MDTVLKCVLIIGLTLGPVQLWANRLHTSGFETNNNTATEWNATAGTQSFDTTTVHSGTYSLKINPTSGTSSITRAVASAKTSGTLFVRFFFYSTTYPSVTGVNLLAIGTTESLDIRSFISSGAKWQLRNAITGTTANGTTVIVDGQWYRVEAKDVLADSGGSMEAKLFSDMGSVPLETLSISNEDTLPTNVSNVFFGAFGTSSTSVIYFDDIAVNDDAGSFQNGYPGPGKIAFTKPTSNNSVTWTKTGANCSGTTNTDCVDDEPGAPDDASGYNTSSTANNEDRFNDTALPSEVPSDAVMILFDIYDRWDGNGTSGTRQGRNLIWDSSSVQTNGTTTTRCDVTAGNWSIATFAQHLVLSLAGFTKANVDNFTMGYEPLNNAECRVTAIWGNVEWKPLTCAQSIALLGVGCR